MGLFGNRGPKINTKPPKAQGPDKPSADGVALLEREAAYFAQLTAEGINIHEPREVTFMIGHETKELADALAARLPSGLFEHEYIAEGREEGKGVSMLTSTTISLESAVREWGALLRTQHDAKTHYAGWSAAFPERSKHREEHFIIKR